MTAATPTRDTVLTALSATADRTANELAQATGLGRSTVTRTLAELEQTGQATRNPGGRDNGRRLPDRWAAASAHARLGKGELRTLVLAYLYEHPGAHSPAAIAKTLGRSAGAVSNALDKLAASGGAIQSSDAPRRYCATQRRPGLQPSQV